MATRDGQETTGVETPFVSRSVPIPSTRLRDVLRLERPIHATWTAPDEPTIVASGVATTITASGTNRFDSIESAGQAAFDALEMESVPAVARPRFVGGFAFHDRHERVSPWEDFPGAWFVLPAVQFVLADGGGWITLTARADERDGEEIEDTLTALQDDLVESGAVSDPPGVVATSKATTYDEWSTQLDAALSRIDAGTLEKVTLAQTLRAELGDRFPLAGTLDRLGEMYPRCYRFAFRPAAERRRPTAPGEEPPDVPTYFGASPERLVARRGSTIETGALASTVARGDDDAEDARLAERLRTDEKFEREHGVVVDSIRRQLEPITGSIRAGDRRIRRLRTVQHLYTPIEAETHADHVLDVVAAMHPTPAVGGRPPDVALETIRESETFERGWYAAPVGWFDDSGDGTFAVGIRSAVATESKAILFAGNGIVAASDPSAEWDEVHLKYEPILDALR
ncbi:MAG: isochorismate synthase MenF [Halanaeroarchaeum sp.]